MKKFLAIFFVVIILMAAQAMAATVTISQLVSSDGGGGPFILTLTGDLTTVGGTPIASTGSVFTSFCVEVQEHISLNGTKYNAKINLDETAMLGGTGEGDPLSVGAAWLLSQHYYDDFKSPTATMLQQAIWYLEEEIPLSTNMSGNTYYQDVIDQFQTLGRAQGNATFGQYGVYVLNLTNADESHAQDQIIMVPNVVPDGGLTVMLLGLGVGGLALFSRKFRQ